MKGRTESLEFLYNLISVFPQGIISFDIEGSVTLLNQAAKNIFKIEGPIHDYIEQPIQNIVIATKLESIVNAILFEKRINKEIKELKIYDEYFNIVIRKITSGTMVFINNVTALIQKKNDALQSIIEGQEIERKRLAKEIHDGIGPDISTIKLGVEGLLMKTTDEKEKAKLQNISAQVSEISNNLRQISHSLMPSSLLDHGLASAIENLIQKLEISNQLQIQFSTNIDNGNTSIETNTSLNVYRVIQEAVQNSLKHGQAKLIDIGLHKKEDQLQLIVEDFSSLTQEEKLGEGIGLLNMKSRIQSVNGQFKAGFKESGGFKVAALIPIHND